MKIGYPKHRCEFVGGMCVICEADPLTFLDDDEVNDEELTVYKRFGIG